MFSTAGGSLGGACCMFFVFFFFLFFLDWPVQKKDPSHPSAAGPAPVAMATAASSPSHQLVEGVFTPRPHQLRGGFLFVCREVLFYFTLHFSVLSTVLRPPGGDDVVVFLAQTHATQASTLNAAVAALTAAASVCVCGIQSLPVQTKG